MPKVSYESLVEKFAELVKEEEDRIKELTREVFKNKKGLSSHPSSLVSSYSNTTYAKTQYEYLRQRYYRLKRVDTANVEQRAVSYLVDDYATVLQRMVDHFRQDAGRQGTRIANEFVEAKRQLMGMTQAEKERFIEDGFNRGLTEKYKELVNDIREEDSEFSSSIIFNIRQAKERAKKFAKKSK